MSLCSFASANEAEKYSIEYLASPDLLIDSYVIPLEDGTERGLYIGIYKKNHFKSFHEFCVFTTNISSLTQMWYTTKDLKKAYSWYYPDETQTGWIEESETKSGNIRKWIQELGVRVDSQRIPDQLTGTFLYFGDSDDFSITGSSGDVFYELYTADLIEFPANKIEPD